MNKLGEFPIVVKFPTVTNSFAITFYGAQGKGTAYIKVFDTNGLLVSSHTLNNVTNGPYGFKSASANIAGFSIYNYDAGGLAIYEIKYA